MPRSSRPSGPWRLLRTGTNSGSTATLNVITAQITLLNNQQTAVSIRSQQMTSSVQLIVALGGGWSAAQLPTPEELTGKAPARADSTR